MSLQLYNSSVFFGSPIYTFPIPDAPTALTSVSTTPSSITVSVTAPAGEVYGYYAYTNTGADANSKTTTITISGLAASTSYTVYVKTIRSYGVDNSGNYVHSAPTSGLNATTSAVNTTFSPTTISGLQLWLDASDPNNTGTAPSNGSTISTWYDRSGNGRNATANSAITYNTSGLSSGKAALTFLASNPRWLTGSINITTNVMTVFHIFSYETSSSSYGRILGMSSGPSAFDYDVGFFSNARDNGANTFSFYRNPVNMKQSVTPSTPFLCDFWYDGTNQYETLHNGSSTSNISSASLSSNFNISYYAIAANTNIADTQYLTGSISEIIIFNTALSTTDRQTVEGYLSWKWGLQAKLASSHPYYLSAPLGSTLSAPTIGSASSITTFTATIGFTAPSGAASGTTYAASAGSKVYGTAVYPATSIYVHGLSSNTSYSFTVTAIASAGTSSASSAVTVLTLPSAPKIGNVSITGTSGTVAFTAPSGSGTITGYTATSIPGGITGTGSSPITVSGLTAGSEYYFTVKATNATGTSDASSYSDLVHGSTADVTTPSSLSVSYTAPKGSRAVRYYAVTNTGVSSYSTTTPITISGLAVSTSYTVTIYGYNIFGKIVSKSSVSATTSAVTATSTIFSSDGTSLTSWGSNGAGGSISGSIGNPSPSISLSGSGTSVVYYNIGQSLLNTTIQFDANTGSLMNLLFACNSSGSGNMWRFEARGGMTGGFAPSPSWGNRIAPSYATYSALSQGTWYTFKIIISSGGVATSYINGTLQSGTYTIANNGNYIGLDGDGGGGTSYVDNISVIGASSALSAPTIGSASSITSSTATISFTAPAGAGSGTTYAASAGGKIYGAAVYPATSIYLDELSSNTSYSFTVTATTSSGTSSASGTVTVLTLAAAPKIGTATVSGTTASVAFTAPTGSGTITSYTATSIPGGITGTGSTSPISVSGLSAPISYYFTVTATNSSGTSASSNYSSQITTSAIPESGLVFQLKFASSSVPTSDTYGTTITTFGTPTMINNATRGYVLSCTNTANLIAQIATTASFSRCLWLYPLSIASNSSNILSTNNFPVWYQNGVNLSMQSTAYTDPVSRGTNLWLHYVVAYDSSTTTLTLYVNGASAVSYTSLVYTGEANYLYINGGNQNGNYTRMNAYYDNIRLYNRALTANEVSAMYTYENSTPTA